MAISRNDTAVELAIFIENDGQIYRSQTQPIIKNLQKKIAKGTYNPTLALKLWRHLADRGAHDYFKQHGAPHTTTWFEMFTTRDRADTAKLLAEYYEEQIREPEPITTIRRRQQRATRKRALIVNKNPKRSIIPNMTGNRVQLHPATDAWMMGDRYGEIIGSGHTRAGKPFYKVRMDVSKKVRKVPIELLDINPRPRRRKASFAHRMRTPSFSLPVKQRRRLSRRRARARTLMGVKPVKITRARKNPVGKFIVQAHGSGGKNWYYRHSTGSFIDRKADATAYKSSTMAARVARSLLPKLPSSIAKLTLTRP